MRNVTVNCDEFLVEVTANREAPREVSRRPSRASTCGSRPNSTNGTTASY